MSTDLKDSAAHVFLRFDGDGLPDTEWLGTHEKHARYRGEIVRADALKWMMDAFNRHTDRNRRVARREPKPLEPRFQRY